jgi:arsenate reductase (thioredoxin)
MKKILFVCIENSNRSQMAEAFAKIHGQGRVEAYSSGSRPSGKVNPKAIAAMAELGYDLSKHVSKSLDEIPQVEYEYAVTMGCGDECPFVKAKHREDWALEDPKNLPPEEFNKVRNEIEKRVLQLIGRVVNGE